MESKKEQINSQKLIKIFYVDFFTLIAAANNTTLYLVNGKNFSIIQVKKKN